MQTPLELPFTTKSGKIDIEGLRVQVKKELERYKLLSDAWITDDATDAFWLSWQAFINQLPDGHTKQKHRLLYQQLQRLPNYIKEWLEKSVETPERMAFFILAKAEEVRSGDQSRDYYLAQSIRYDQLMAVTRVLRQLIEYLRKSTNVSFDTIKDDAVFLGLLDYPLEDQVFLEAQKVHADRLAFWGGHE